MSPLLAIFVFISIIAVLPFYESKRFSIWETQEARPNIFTETVLKYSLFSESLKAELGLTDYFNKDQEFWSNIKISPVVSEIPGTENIENYIAVAERPIKIINEIPDETESNPVPAETKEPETTPTPPSKTEPKPEQTPKSETPPTQTQPNQETTNKPTEGTKPQSINTTKMEPPFRILIMGDSFMAIGGGLGDPLERSFLAYKDVSVNRLGRVSSGLSVPSYFNWYTTAETLINQYNPNVAVVMFGANDGQGITSSAGKIIQYGQPGWNEEYAKKVGYFINILEKNNITIFWVGLPIMKDARFSAKVANLNSIYEAEAKNHENVYFISTWDSLADENGKYTSYLKDASGKSKLIRASDGIHLQYYAGYLLSAEIISKMQEVMNLEKITK